jgi:small GTP-binding protein
MNYDYFSKVLIIGDAYVGKTTFLDSLIGRRHSSSYVSTIGLDLHIELIKSYKGDLVKCHLWDLAGHERFRAITKGYFREATCAILMFDLSDYKSFQSLKTWLDMINNNTVRENIPIILVGSKKDKRRGVSAEKARIFAYSNNMKYMEITSKNENNAKHVLVELINMFVDKTDELGIKKNKNNNSSLKARYKMCHVDKKDISCCLIS